MIRIMYSEGAPCPLCGGKFRRDLCSGSLHRLRCTRCGSDGVSERVAKAIRSPTGDASYDRVVMPGPSWRVRATSHVVGIPGLQTLDEWIDANVKDDRLQGKARE